MARAGKGGSVSSAWNVREGDMGVVQLLCPAILMAVGREKSVEACRVWMLLEM